MPELFPDKNIAEKSKLMLNYFCENSLKSNKILKPMVRKNLRRNL